MIICTVNQPLRKWPWLPVAALCAWFGGATPANSQGQSVSQAASVCTMSPQPLTLDTKPFAFDLATNSMVERAGRRLKVFSLDATRGDDVIIEAIDRSAASSKVSGVGARPFVEIGFCAAERFRVLSRGSIVAPGSMESPLKLGATLSNSPKILIAVYDTVQDSGQRTLQVRASKVVSRFPVATRTITVGQKLDRPGGRGDNQSPLGPARFDSWVFIVKKTSFVRVKIDSNPETSFDAGTSVENYWGRNVRILRPLTSGAQKLDEGEYRVNIYHRGNTSIPTYSISIYELEPRVNIPDAINLKVDSKYKSELSEFDTTIVRTVSMSEDILADNSDEFLDKTLRYYKIFRFNATAGNDYTVRMTSKTVDTFLEIVAPSSPLSLFGVVAQNDDAGDEGEDELGSKLRVSAQTSGEILIRASTALDGQVGSFEIEVEDKGKRK